VDARATIFENRYQFAQPALVALSFGHPIFIMRKISNGEIKILNNRSCKVGDPDGWKYDVVRLKETFAAAIRLQPFGVHKPPTSEACMVSFAPHSI
jgi:hypothetical protein